MGFLNMDGPFDFNNDSINMNVTKVSGGNYALGTVDKDTGNFHVTYIGRSDSDIKNALMQQLTEAKVTISRYEPKSLSFKYSYASSPKEAFEKECYNYHNFIGSKKLVNNLHPENIKNADWRCPICNE